MEPVNQRKLQKSGKQNIRHQSKKQIKANTDTNQHKEDSWDDFGKSEEEENLSIEEKEDKENTTEPLKHITKKSITLPRRSRSNSDSNSELLQEMEDATTEIESAKI